ncbi:(ABC) transporter [Perkinsus chesapeaki]|uniref:(ABC) transporter n=1 Tax=Perkinsus chesapeaki TaxID=330153 RepID=A0A7J6LZT4_PERCH|nr:(ABC) transporter [Perkinsus chesapeaki]
MVKFSFFKIFSRDRRPTGDDDAGSGPEVEEENINVSYFKLYSRAPKKDYYALGCGVIAALINGALMPLFALLFGDFANASAGTLDGFMDRIVTVTWQMCVLAGVALITGSVFNSCFTYFSENQASRLRVSYLQAVVGQDIAWFDMRTPAALPSRMAEDVLKVRDAIGSKASLCCVNISMAVVGYIVAFYRGWQITLVMMSSMPLIMVAGALMAKVMSSLSSKGQTMYAAAGAVAEEVLGSIKTVAAFGGEKRSITKYAQVVEDALKAGIRGGLFRGLSIGFTMTVVFWTYALTFWYGGTLIRDGTINPSTGLPYQGGDVLTVFMSAIMGTFSLAQIAPHVQSFAEGCAAGGKIYPLFEQKASIEPRVQRLADVDDPTAEMKPLHLERFELEKVKFHYPARPELQVIKGVSLAIERGQKVAFVGESGSGKSTLVQMMERFYDPTEGRVLVNGVDIKTVPVHQHRALFGYVGQEPFLFADSIRNNLTYGLVGKNLPSEAAIRDVCKKAQILSFIESLPEGFDTYAGPGGSQVSGGQKQRIAIARALLRKPQILLLDEATSALDNESEKMVQATIDHLQSTVSITTISIAHRLSTIKNSDKIFVMRGGELVEQGSHSELMNHHGVYSALVSAQMAAGDNADRVQRSHRSSSFAGDDLLRTTTSASRKQSTILSEVQGSCDFGAQLLSQTEEDREAERKKAIAKAYKTPWMRLLRLSKNEKWWFVPGLTGAFIAGAGFPLNSLLLAHALTAFYYPPSLVMEHVSPVALYYVGLGALLFIGHVLQSVGFSYIGENFTANVRKQCFAKIMEQDMGFFDFPEHAAGKLTASLSTYAVKMNSLTGTSLSIYAQAATGMIVGVIIGFTGSWQLTLVMLAMVPFLGIAGKINMSVRVVGKEEQDELKQAQLVASEAVQNMRTVRAFMAESWTVEAYEHYASRSSNTSFASASVRGLTFGASNCIIFLAYAIGFYYGGHLIAYEGLDFTKMLQSLMSIMFAAMAVGQAMAFLPDVAEAKVSAHDVFEILDTQSKINAMHPDGTIEKLGDGIIEFRDVHFSYPTHPEVEILKGVSFKIEPGQQVAFVGPSGSGKSTVMALMQRFYDVSGGSVKVGGEDIRMMNVAWWRGQNGYVGQEPVLFDMTLAENVRYGKEDATMGELETVAKMANMDYVTSMGGSVKWDDPMGPKGCRLSGGQKQRAAIARALVRDPHIIFLDEATSALDSTSEKIVQNAIDTAAVGRTSVTIAHRLSTVRNCDVIYVVADGKIVESGDHESLMAKHGVYYDLYEKGQK